MKWLWIGLTVVLLSGCETVAKNGGYSAVNTEHECNKE